MVITQLIGGLGNQLFQYATARAIAYHHQVPLVLDISAFDNLPNREYKLHHFNIGASKLSPEYIACLTRQDERNWWQRTQFLIRHKLPLHKHIIVQQTSRYYDAEILSAGSNIYLKGYWQTEKYFCTIRSLLLPDLSLKVGPSEQNQQFVNAIQECHAVSVHVRRGDYVTNPSANQAHGVCSLDYYREAITFISQQVAAPHLFVFSDDVAWVRENLQVGFPTTYVSHNGAHKDYEDLRLMTYCKHHIIANSTFSWWGAWLCTHPDKIVIVPQQWFKDSSRDEGDIVPNNWLRV